MVEFLLTVESALMEILALAVLTEALMVPAQCALDLSCAEESAHRDPWDHLPIALDRDRLTLSTLVLHRVSTLKQPGSAHLLQVPFMVTALLVEAQLLEAVIPQACSDLLRLHTLVSPLVEVDHWARVTFPLAESARMGHPYMQAILEVP